MFCLAESQGRRIQQGTQEWLDMRQLYITGTRAHDLFSSHKTRQTLLYKLLAAYDCKSLHTEEFKSQRMEKAHEDEKAAIASYSFLNDLDIRNQDDFLLSESYRFAALSPDGIIYQGDRAEGAIEVKCLDKHNHIAVAATDVIDKSYYAQCEWTAFITGVPWCIYYGFCPELNRFAEYEKVIELKDTRRAEIEDIYLSFEQQLLNMMERYGVHYETRNPSPALRFAKAA